MTEPVALTVAIPVRNGAHVIARQLEALCQQSWDQAWELVIVDNGSTDDLPAAVEPFRSRLPGLRVVHEPRAGIGPARNRALAEARGPVLAIVDCDDVVQPGWLSAIMDAMRAHDLVGGVLDPTGVNDPDALAWRGQQPHNALSLCLGAWPFAAGGNMAVRVDVAKAIGGWDEDFVAGGDDVDFSWRAVGRGFDLGFAPGAVVAYSYRPGLAALRRQFYAYGKAEALLYAKHRHSGLRRYGLLELLRTWRRVVPHVLHLGSRDVRRRGFAVRELAYHGGRLVGSTRHRVLLP